MAGAPRFRAPWKQDVILKRMYRSLNPLVFLLLFCNLNSCAAQESQAEFYQGLLRRADAENAGTEESRTANRKAAVVLFERALLGSNVVVRQAAAAELAGLMYGGEQLSGPTLDRVRREAAGSWARAFGVLAADPGEFREKALDFILGSGESGGLFPDAAALYVLRQCRDRAPDFFSPLENAVIEGRIAASRSRFAEALALFRAVADEDPEIFFRYPDLLNDLGRSFQYAAVGTGGIDLFLDWEQELAERAGSGTPLGEAVSGIRFRLFFFAARIARQRGLIDQGIDCFIRALAFAPDAAQADACIWYILDSALYRGPVVTMRRLEALIPQWHDDAYFFDVLDKLSRELILRRQWEELINVFSLLRGRFNSLKPGESAGGAALAKYAYIIGRALDEGYLPPDLVLQAAAAIAANPRNAAVLAEDRKGLSRAYLQIAYDTGSASFYYRSQSAAVLSEPFLELPDKPEKRPLRSGGQSPEMAFLLGFFKHKAAVFAPPYIKALEPELSAGELRTLAAALGETGQYAESIRLVSVFTGKEGYALNRRDLELYYPRPFKELVEQYAAETGLAPELLFGLIRTESAFQSDIVSRAGAVGLTQLMPATAGEMANLIRRQGGPDYVRPENTGPDLRDPEINIHIGAIYLDYLMERMEDTLLTLLAYNGGMNRVRRWRAADNLVTPGGLPTDLFLETVEYAETREYGRKVLAAAAIYRELYYNHNG
jgi:soluble lytic murein transglycosylase